MNKEENKKLPKLALVLGLIYWFPEISFQEIKDKLKRKGIYITYYTFRRWKMKLEEDLDVYIERVNGGYKLHSKKSIFSDKFTKLVTDFLTEHGFFALQFDNSDNFIAVEMKEGTQIYDYLVFLLSECDVMEVRNSFGDFFFIKNIDKNGKKFFGLKK